MSEGPPVVLDDGRTLTIRPIRADDTEQLRAMHRRHSPATIRRRFFAMLPELDPKQADRFTGTADAEVAIVVQDDFQHHGLGTTLLNELTRYARDHGIARFIADVLMENSPMFATFADAGLVGTSQYESGVAHLVLTIPPA
jgi:GNAT superfamily N-acetyltransferase